MAALEWIHGRDQRWIARGRRPLQGERGCDDGDRRARAFGRDATGRGDSRHRRHRFRVSRGQAPPARYSGGSGVGHAKSREYIKIGRERSDRSGAIISDIRADESGRIEVGRSAATIATTKTTAKISATVESELVRI